MADFLFQVDYQCTGCGSWYRRRSGETVRCNVCGQIDARGGRRPAAERKPWKAGKPSFGMGWNKNQHKSTPPGGLA